MGPPNGPYLMLGRSYIMSHEPHTPNASPLDSSTDRAPSKAEQNPEVSSLIAQKYQHGFVTDIESEVAARGLSEETVRFISAKKEEPEWLLEWRLRSLELFLAIY